MSLKLFAVAAAMFALSTAVVAAPEVSAWAAPQVAEMDAFGFGRPVEGMTFEGAATATEVKAIEVSVTSRGSYAFVAGCGGDCADVGLLLKAADGHVVTRGVPGFKAQLAPGDYTLHLGFQRCVEVKCRYVVRGYRAAG
ncbi:hypothetical protein [Caulobacter sp. 17J65-9]|uniref:hypothetical protein n=1 Tax=Caulobacter sp. 17J65-9 TaxID=2709382 RepID=UPI0013C66027|nr:hypothetical protein [Caulobacter sp. 17J65-9]NEX94756.1 hypothetical protein [Caulobacter sp. 17J65-9]